MPSAKTITKQQTRKVRNFVAEQSKAKSNAKAVKKEYIPGIYAGHHPSQCDHMLLSRPIHLKLETALEGKDVVKVVSRDNVRDLLIPSGEINVYPAIWEKEKIDRLLSAGKVISLDDRIQMIELSEAEKQKQMKECEARKLKMKEIDKIKAEKHLATKKTNNEGEVDESALVLDRAFLAKQEEEEEVKRANRVILATKVHIVRDAQVAEKNEISRELREENLRLEKMMMEERERSLKLEDKNREKARLIKTKHGLEIQNQLKEKEMVRIMEAERIEEEAKAMAKAQIAITVDMMEKEKERRNKVLQTRLELQKANDLSTYFKRLHFEEQRIADLKVQEYMREKAEREKRIALEKRLAREQREREQERMLQLQQKILDNKTENNEMDLRRAQELKEREYRNKEKEAVLKKKEMDKQIAAFRQEQVEAMKKVRALQMAKDEVHFCTTLEKLQNDERIEKEKTLKQKTNRLNYREDIIKQMNEKELLRREMKRRAKNEYYASQEAERNRQKNVNNAIITKIQQMRNANVPEKFIKDVERQLNVVK